MTRQKRTSAEVFCVLKISISQLKTGFCVKFAKSGSHFGGDGFMSVPDFGYLYLFCPPWVRKIDNR